MNLNEVEITVYSGMGTMPSTQATEPHPTSLEDVFKQIAEPQEGMIELKRTCVELYSRYRAAEHTLGLTGTKSGNDPDTELVTEAAKARKEYTKTKSYFPIACFSGAFIGRNDSDITASSGFIMVDVDGKDQDSALDFGANMKKFRADIYAIEHVQAVFTSPSEEGFHILVRVDPTGSTPEFLKEYYRQVYEKIAEDLRNRLGFIADPTCKNISRACFVSPDPDILIKDSIAIPFPFRFSKTEATKERKRRVTKESAEMKELLASARSDNRVFAEALLAECTKNRISITEKYDDWIKVGFILMREFGDDGFDLFSGFSMIDASFDPEECRNQWEAFNCDDRNNPVTFATLVWMAKRAGVSLLDKMRVVDMVERYIDAHYDLRRNVLDEGIYWRRRDSAEELRAFNLDFDEAFLTRDVQRALNKDVGINTIGIVIRDLAQRTNWNPMRDYLNSLVWDGEDRLGQIMSGIQTDNDELFRRYFPKWYIGIVAAALGECANDKSLVFTGPQGTFGKTFFFANLLPKRVNGWSFVHVVEKFNPTDKDDIRKALTSMLIVFDEMSAYARADLEQLKSLITKEWINFRGVWGKSYTDFWKTASFAGCTNHDEFLRDTTGDRRYLVFKLLGRDKDAFDSIDKEQLLAQAVAMFKEGFDHRLSTDDYTEIIKRNRFEFTSASTDEMMLREYLEPSTSPEDTHTLTEIIRQFKDRYGHDFRSSTVTLGKNLSNMGIVVKPTYRKGGTVRLYQCKFVQPKTQKIRQPERLTIHSFASLGS